MRLTLKPSCSTLCRPFPWIFQLVVSPARNVLRAAKAAAARRHEAGLCKVTLVRHTASGKHKSISEAASSVGTGTANLEGSFRPLGTRCFGRLTGQAEAYREAEQRGGPSQVWNAPEGP